MEPARLVFIALFYAAGALVHASLAVFLRNGASPCAQRSPSAQPARHACRHNVLMCFNWVFNLRRCMSSHVIASAGIARPAAIDIKCHNLVHNRSARERAKAATIAYTAVTVAFNVSFVLRPGELDLVSNPPWTRVAAVMAVFTFFDGVRGAADPDHCAG